jgi:hypothetical protein
MCSKHWYVSPYNACFAPRFFVLAGVRDHGGCGVAVGPPAAGNLGFLRQWWQQQQQQ